MQQSERLHTFIALGEYLRSDESAAEREQICHRANFYNNWFTPENNHKALNAIANDMLTTESLTNWLAQYNPEPAEPKTIGVAMAGNIPAVGFHDLLCVLISGHKLLAKTSSQDFALIQYLIQKITEINPAFAERITIAERLNAADAFIATGSDNTARYFEYYFGKRPHIIRRNRTSVGILTGQESPEEFARLGDDILTYFGLGCRNVSTLLVPESIHGAPYDFIPLLQTLDPLAPTYRNLSKWVNNYDYNKSIYLVNGVPHFDNGFLLLTQQDGLVSPISVVYYQTYRDADHAAALLARQADKIQVVASADGAYPGSVPFGQTQHPTLTDYPDGIDTMAFLAKL
ncbi:acyl-CoA reductase [Rudanella lutea]|uniref:acyl-CoA reductase n=1 Tax=Rudanella lutea TaxID=451374 RepID=UPI00047F3575|nr:acyl-CoA reductase [Rudanella lutea]